MYELFLASQLEFYTNISKLKSSFFLLKISVAILIPLINIISKTKFSIMFLPKSREFFITILTLLNLKKIQNDLHIKLKLNRKIRNINLICVGVFTGLAILKLSPN